MLARVPLAFSFDLDPCAVDQKMQRLIRATIGNVDRQKFLATTERAEIRDRPRQPGQTKQTFDKTGRLPQGHTKQNLQRQTGLDGDIAIVWSAAAPSRREPIPGHGRVKPHRQGASLLQCGIIRTPVRRPVSNGRWFAHAHPLPEWVGSVNPSRLCNKAGGIITAGPATPLQRCPGRVTETAPDIRLPATPTTTTTSGTVSPRITIAAANQTGATGLTPPLPRVAVALRSSIGMRAAVQRQPCLRIATSRSTGRAHSPIPVADKKRARNNPRPHLVLSCPDKKRHTARCDVFLGRIICRRPDFLISSGSFGFIRQSIGDDIIAELRAK